MSKVVIFRPTYLEGGKIPGGYLIAVHIGTLSVGASLRKAGYDVVLVDALIHDNWRERLVEESKDAVYVGVSAMTSQVRSGIEAAQLLRSKGVKTPLVWGGVHPSVFPEQTATSEWCDVVAVGEGDETAVSIARALESGGALEGMEGVATRSGDRVVNTPKTLTLKDLDVLPDPAYDLYTRKELEDFITASMMHPGEAGKRFFGLHCGRGCRFQCTFCINTILNETNRRHRSKSAARIISEMEVYGPRYNIELFGLQDEDFFTEKDKIMEFLDLYEKKGFQYKWSTTVRANYFRDDYINRDFCKRLAAAGCVSIGMGVESGSLEMLKRMKKGITTDMVLRAAQTTAGTGVILTMSFMVGMPGETERDMAETIRILWQIHSHLPGQHFFIGPAEYRPYPGSKMFQEAVELGLTTPQTLEEWGDQNLSKWGYTSESAMPWVRNKDMLHYVTTLTPFLLISAWTRHYRFKKLLLMILRPIAQLRLRTGYWGALLELKLFLALKSVWKGVGAGD